MALDWDTLERFHFFTNRYFSKSFSFSHAYSTDYVMKLIRPVVLFNVHYLYILSHFSSHYFYQYSPIHFRLLSTF